MVVYWILLLVPIKGSSQLFSLPNKAETESYRSELQQISSPKKVYQFIEKVLNETKDTSLIIAQAYQQAATLHKQSNQDQQAINNERQALTIYQQLLGNKHVTTAHCQSLLGHWYHKTNQHSAAIKYLKAAHLFFVELKQHEALPIASQLATVYQETNEPDSALLVLGHTIATLEQEPGITSESIGQLLLQEGKLMVDEDRHEEATAAFLNAIELYEADCISTYHEEQLILAYQYYAQQLKTIDLKTEALAANQQALLINEERPDLKEQRISLLFGLQGLEDHSKATKTLEDIKQLTAELPEEKQGYFHHNLKLEEAQQLLRTGNAKQGIKAFGKALKNYVPESVHSTLPEPEQLKFVSAKKELAEAYLEWIDLLEQQNRKKKNRSNLSDALKITQLADELVKLETKQFQRTIKLETIGKIYRKGAALAHQLNKPEEAWYFHEQLRAMKLLAQYPVAKIAKLTGIPDELQHKKERLEYQLDSLQQFLLPLKANGKQYAMGKVVKAIQLIHQQWIEHEERLITEFPRYQQFWQQFEPVSLEAIRDYLTDNGAELISYVVTDTSVLAMQVDNWKKKLFTIPNQALTQENAAHFKVLTETKTSDLHLVDSLGQRLYSALFESMAYGKKRVVVLADQWLHRFPFDALVKPQKRNTPLKDRWLVNHKQFSFAGAVGVLIKGKDPANQSITGEGILVTVPSQFPGSGKPPLLEAEAVNRYIIDRFEVDTLRGNKTSADQFLAKAKDKLAVHLTTHIRQFPTPLIYLYEDQLLLDALTLEDYNSALWVLSHLDWDGLSSNAVLAAEHLQLYGIEGVVASTLQTELEVSNTLLLGFYRSLLSGKSQVEALQKTKLNLLKAGKVHPYYWAGYAHYGHSEKVRAADYDGMTYIMAAFLLLILVVWTMGYRPQRDDS